MRRNPTLIVAGAAAGVAVIQLALHWSLGRGLFPSLLGIYLDRGSSGKAFYKGVVDNQLPGAVLGLICGWVAFPRWSPRTTATVVGVLAAFVASLELAYRQLIGAQLYATVWGLPRSSYQAILFHLYDFFTALLVSGFFARMTYGGHRDLLREKSNSPSK